MHTWKNGGVASSYQAALPVERSFRSRFCKLRKHQLRSTANIAFETPLFLVILSPLGKTPANVEIPDSYDTRYVLRCHILLRNAVPLQTPLLFCTKPSVPFNTFLKHVLALLSVRFNLFQPLRNRQLSFQQSSGCRYLTSSKSHFAPAGTHAGKLGYRRRNRYSKYRRCIQQLGRVGSGVWYDIRRLISFFDASRQE